MPLSAVAIKGYRSIRNLYLPVEACSIFIGANGVGKTNLYKALGLLRAAAEGSITRAIAVEGGIESVAWSGTQPGDDPAYRISPRARLILKAHFDDLAYDVAVGLPHSYEVEIGLRKPTEAAFVVEPLVKRELLTTLIRGRKVAMMERKGPMVALRDENGRRVVREEAVLSSETALGSFRDGGRYPELESVRREMLDWRLYHDFRTDEASSVRRP